MTAPIVNPTKSLVWNRAYEVAAQWDLGKSGYWDELADDIAALVEAVVREEREKIIAGIRADIEDDTPRDDWDRGWLASRKGIARKIAAGEL